MTLVESYGEVVFASMIFSVLSLVITALSMVSQRNLINAQHFASIEFDVTGTITTDNKQKCRNRVKKIQSGMAMLMGLDEKFLEISRPTPTKDGLRIHINIYINHTKSIGMNIEKDMKEAQMNGRIAYIIETAWKLSANPDISNVKYTKHKSQRRKENEVDIVRVYKMTEQSIGAQIEMGRMRPMKQDFDVDEEESIEELYDEIKSEVEGVDMNNDMLQHMLQQIQSGEHQGEKSHDSHTNSQESNVGIPFLE